MLNIDERGDLGWRADDLVGACVGVLGVRGSGKSNTAAVLLEELLPFMAGTVVDIDGDHWGLKAMFPQMVLAGGSHADTPLTDPVRLARRSFEDDVPVLLDFSDMREAEMMENLEQYLTALWGVSSPEAARKPYLLLIEEAHKFIPQGRETEVKDILRDFAARGRKRGIMLVLVSQRSQKVDKDTLTSATHYLLHRVFHPNDLRTYQELIPRDAQRVAQLVNELGTGEAISRDGARVQVVGIRQRKTFHAGATPKLRRAEEAGKIDEKYDGKTASNYDTGARGEASRGQHAELRSPRDGEIPANQRFPWAAGINAAWDVIALLADACTRITVGGSLRRGKDTVGDVEIIAQPGDVLRFERRCDLLRAWGTFTPRLNKIGNRIAWGPRFKAAVYAGLPLDIFIVLPDRQWGPTCVIRTGPGTANECLVTTLGIRNRLGDVGVLPTGVAFSDGGLIQHGVKLDTKEEMDVFNACRLPWVEPGLRSVATYREAASAARDGAEYVGKAVGDASLIQRWDFVKFDERYWRLDPIERLASKPELAALVERLREAEVVETVEQGLLWQAGGLW